MRILNFKKLLFVVSICLFSISSSFSQDIELNESGASRQAFLGLGWGINDYGLGLSLEVPLTDKIYGIGNLGTSGWGGRYGVGLMYFPKESGYGSAFSLGYSMASGISDYKVDLEVEPSNNEKEVTLDLDKLSTINMVYYYNIPSGRRNKLTLSLGYSFLLSDDNYEVASGEDLNDVSETVLKIMEPGGLILGIRYMFGLKSY